MLLDRSLERLREKDTQPDEVLIVDDGGEDHTEAVAGFYGCRYIYTHHPGPQICSHARNVGLTHTDCDVIITSEPEVRFDTDVIGQLLHAHVHTYPNDVLTAGVVRHEQDPVTGIPPNRVVEPNTVVEGNHLVLTNWAATYVALYRRDWLMEIGGWDETFPEPWGWDDTDLCTRLRLRGHNQKILTDVVVEHQWHPQTHNDQKRNADHFFAKDFGSEDPANPNIWIPREDGWGTPLTRS